MSAKSSIKLLVPDSQQGRLYKWIAILTGSKNALKGVGFFLGGALLTLLGFAGAVLAMAAVLAVIWISSLVLLKRILARRRPNRSSRTSSPKARQSTCCRPRGCFSSGRAMSGSSSRYRCT